MRLSPTEDCQVALVVAPFTPIFQASLAAGLLKAILRQAGFSTRVFYPNLDLAARLDPWMTQVAAFDLKDGGRVGDYVFSHLLFDHDEHRLREYYENVLSETAVGMRLRALLQLWSSRADPVAAVQCIVDDIRRWVPVAVEHILSCKPRIVAISTAFQTLPATLLLLREIKRARPEIATVVGGGNVAGPPSRKIIQLFPQVDYACNGEGDVAFPRLVSALLAGRDHTGIPGIVGRTKAGEPEGLPPDAVSPQELNSAPVPDLSDYFETLLGSPVLASRIRPSLPVQTSRGCFWGQKHHCVFCGISDMELVFREKSLERALSEIQTVYGAYGRHCSSVTIADNTTSPAHLKRFLPALAEAIPELPPVWIETQANLKREDMAVLRQANVRSITAGIESMDANTLHLMNKGTNPVINIQTLKWADEMGVWCRWNWLVGFMGETEMAATEVESWIGKIFHLSPPWFEITPIALPRFSPYAEDPRRFGMKAPNHPQHAYRYVYPFSEEDIDDIAYYKENEDQTTVADTVLPGISHIRQRWAREFPSSHLLLFEGPNKDTVLDTRTCRVKTLWRLAGLSRLLNRACDTGRTPKSLVSEFEARFGAQAVETALDELVAGGLVLASGEKVVSLTVRWSLQYRRRAAEGESITFPTPLDIERTSWFREYRRRLGIGRIRGVALTALLPLWRAADVLRRIFSLRHWRQAFLNTAIVVLGITSRLGRVPKTV